MLGGDGGEREVPAPTGTPTHSTRAGESALMAALTSVSRLGIGSHGRIPAMDPNW